jgi:hypothetical protein
MTRLQLPSPRSRELVQSLVVDNFCSLLKLNADDALLMRFCSTYGKWLEANSDREALRRETVRLVSHRLINRLNPGEAQTLAITRFRTVLELREPYTKEDPLIVAALWALKDVKVTSARLGRLFVQGFQAATKIWDPDDVLTWCRQLVQATKSVERDDLNGVHAVVSLYRGTLSLDRTGRTQRDAFSKVLADLRFQEHRPPSRVPIETIHATLIVVDVNGGLGELVEGAVENLRVPSGSWQGGVWMTSAVRSQHLREETWRPIQLRVDVQPPLVLDAEARAEFNRSVGSHGYRVKIVGGQLSEFVEFAGRLPAM